MSQHTLKIGQKVKIDPISENKKEYYPWSWVDDMNKHVGKIVTISSQVDEQYPDYIGKQECYTIKENIWTWDIQNLSIVED
jgi:hypothetical protein